MVKLGKRNVEPIVKELTAAGKQVVSISKLNTIADNGCLYEGYLTYVLGKRGTDGIYGALGGIIHDKLQMIMEQQETRKCLLPALDETLKNLNMVGIDFPKDKSGGTAIKDSWLADMTHFCKNFIPPAGEFTTEEFCLLKVNEDLYLQGYIDLIQHHKDGSISIWDWKTSTNFKTSDLLHHGRQLVCYVMAKEAEGFRVRQAGWIMLKYVEVVFRGKARANSKGKTEIHKIVNRGKLVQELAPYLKKNLLDCLDELSADVILEQAVKENDMTILPQNVQALYTIKPYVRKYEVTNELKQETFAYIEKNAAVFREKSDSASDWPPKPFYKYGRNGRKIEDCFYCHSLCNHRNTCVYIKQHDEQLLSVAKDIDEEISDLF